MAGVFIQGGRVVVDGAALQSMLSSPYGPVGVEMLAVAETVLDHAVAHCPVESAESAARHKRQPGRLKASLHIKRETFPGLERGLFFLVGSDLIYARRIEFNHTVGGFLRGALAAAAGAHSLAGISPRAVA